MVLQNNLQKFWKYKCYGPNNNDWGAIVQGYGEDAGIFLKLPRLLSTKSFCNNFSH